MFKTRITEMFDIEYPIIQGAMQWLSRAELVAAVSNAGGLGVISSLTLPTAKELRHEIRKTKHLTDRPFAVNITLLPTTRPIDYEEYIEAVLEEGVKVIETSGRSVLSRAGSSVVRFEPTRMTGGEINFSSRHRRGRFKELCS